MKKSFKIRLKPTPQQTKLFWQFSGTSRFLYNWFIDRQSEHYKSGEKGLIHYFELSKRITQLKKTEDFKWLNQVSADLPCIIFKDCYLAYKAFFRKKKWRREA